MERLKEWQRRTEWPLSLCAALFLVAFALPIVDTDLSHPWIRAFSIVTWATWGLFGVDYIVRISLAPNRRQYVVKHWYDFFIVFLPLLRPFRLLRLVTLVRVLNRNASISLRGRVATYVVSGSAFVTLCGALAVLQAERPDPHANIKGFGDAIWWALTTMTTVGYGDKFPITLTGRVVASVLMIGGIAVLGLTTATVASYLVEHVSTKEDDRIEQVTRQLSRMEKQMAEVSRQLEELKRIEHRHPHPKG